MTTLVSVLLLVLSIWCILLAAFTGSMLFARDLNTNGRITAGLYLATLVVVAIVIRSLAR